MKHFWTQVAIDEARVVTLDGKPVRTPGRRPLALPTDALAQAVAEEWRAVGTVQMQAAALVADDLLLRADGNGDLTAQARATAGITSAGVGTVTVYGKPACTVRGRPAGPVSCGLLPLPAP